MALAHWLEFTSWLASRNSSSVGVKLRRLSSWIWSISSVVFPCSASRLARIQRSPTLSGSIPRLLLRLATAPLTEPLRNSRLAWAWWSDRVLGRHRESRLQDPACLVEVRSGRGQFRQFQVDLGLARLLFSTLRKSASASGRPKRRRYRPRAR